MADGPPQAHLDALAQQQGFPSYAAWAAWNQHQQMVRAGNGINGTAAPALQQAEPPQNWLQHILGYINPGLGYVRDNVTKALGGQ